MNKKPFVWKQKSKTMLRLFSNFAIAAMVSTTPAFFEKPLATSNFCPKVVIECNSGKLCCDSPFEFKAHIENIRAIDKPTFKWIVFGGKIISGQGTSTIKVDSTGFKGSSTYAVVEVGGLETGCELSGSITQEICESPPITEIDAYRNIPFRKEKSRLDRFANEIKEIPQSQGYLIAFNNNGKRAKRAKQYLIKKHSIETDRIIIIESGKRANLIMRLYLVPLGAQPPTPDW